MSFTSAQTLIFEIISKFENVQEFIFNNNTVKKGTGAQELFNAIGKCGQKTLEILRIKSCTYSVTSLSQPQTISAFSSCISLLKNLRILNLSYSNLNDALIKGLAESLPE